jgi:hypothetical protein
MRVAKWSRALSLFVAIALAPASAFSDPSAQVQKSFKDASNGPPLQLLRGELNDESYVTFPTIRLKKAQTIYVSRRALLQDSVKVPATVYAPDFLKEINDEWGFGIRKEGDSPDEFGTETKTFYTDRYGGMGANGSRGGGRTASAGSYQSKGVLTPLAPSYEDALKKGDPGYNIGSENSWLGQLGNGIGQRFSAALHSHGRLAMRQGIIEQIFSSILDNDLDLGSNLQAFMLKTGQSVPLSVPLAGAIKEPAALGVRRVPLRPANYIVNEVAKDQAKNGKDTQLLEEDAARISKLMPQMIAALPQPPGPVPTDEGEKLRSGILEFSNRIGRQFGAMYARSFYHGSNSPSNFQLDGKMLDLSSVTALDGFPQAMFQDDYPNGDLRTPKNDIIDEFIESLQLTLPPELKKSLPTKEEAYAALEKGNQDQLDRDFLWLTGTPSELLDAVKGKPSAQTLTALLQKMAKAGNTKRVQTSSGVPTHTGTYDLEAVLKALSTGDTAALTKAVPGARVRVELTRAYQSYYNFLARTAAAENISQPQLKEFMKLETAQRNRKLTGLYRGSSQWVALIKQLASYEISGDPVPIREFIDSRIQENIRTFRNAPPYTAVLSHQAMQETGNSILRVYDARTGKKYVVLDAEVSDGKANLFGQEVPLEDLEKVKLAVGSGEAKTVDTAPKEPSPDRVVLHLPDFELKVGFSLSIQSGDGKLTQLRTQPGSGALIRLIAFETPEENCVVRAIKSFSFPSSVKGGFGAGMGMLKGLMPGTK